MKLTRQKLKNMNPCVYGYDWYLKQKTTDFFEIIKRLKSKKCINDIKKYYKDSSLSWANWIIVRMMKYEQYVSYAVYAAEQIIDIYEKKYQDDDRPRKAIESAKLCIKNNSEKNKNSAAYAAAYAYAAAVAAAGYAYDAAYAAYAAAYAAYAAAYAAYAAYADDAAAYAAYAAYVAYAYADDAAAYADDDTDHEEKLQIKIINYGIKLLRSNNGTENN